MTKKGKYLYFTSRNSAKKDVVLYYDGAKMRANKATFDTSKNKLVLAGGFYMEYLDYTISGEEIIYNASNMFFDASDVVVQTKSMTYETENFSFYGKSVSLKKLEVGITQLKLDLAMGQLDIYPGWYVAKHIFLKLFGYPFFYAPQLIIDERRNSYQLPDPLPQFGENEFRGRYWRENIHVYGNEYIYGNLQFGRSEEKGAGYGGQAIVRLSERDHLTYITDNWQYDRTQELLSYEHSFIDLPNKKKISFNDLFRYNENIRDLSGATIRIDASKYEEINNEIVNREPEIIFDGTFPLPYYGLVFRNKTSHGVITEVTRETEATKYEFLNELSRPINLPFDICLTPGLGYDNVQYNKNPFFWYREYDFIQGQKKFWIFTAKGTVVDYLREKGGSPFRYDKKYEDSDYVKTDVSMKLFHSRLGQQTKYTLEKYKITDIVYYLKLHQRSWSLNAEYSIKKEEWAVDLQIMLL